jgi:hypothetical protein
MEHAGKLDVVEIPAPARDLVNAAHGNERVADDGIGVAHF